MSRWCFTHLTQPQQVTTFSAASETEACRQEKPMCFLFIAVVKPSPDCLRRVFPWFLFLLEFSWVHHIRSAVKVGFPEFMNYTMTGSQVTSVHKEDFTHSRTGHFASDGRLPRVSCCRIACHFLLLSPTLYLSFWSFPLRSSNEDNLQFKTTVFGRKCSCAPNFRFISCNWFKKTIFKNFLENAYFYIFIK